MIAQVISSLTVSLRFESALNVDINEYQTNLVPYPKICFMLNSFAPMLHKDDKFDGSMTATDLTLQSFEPE